MLATIVTTALDNLWYEIWENKQDGKSVFTAIRYDGELGTAKTVCNEWQLNHAERMAHYDMAGLGIA